MISIIVPVYNEEKTLEKTLRCLAHLPGEKEILIADGGSTDSTRTIAEKEGILLDTPKGRARQMNEAAKQARGEILWFVHSDSVVSENSLKAIENAIQTGRIGGCFSLYFYDGKGFNLWWIARLSNRRAKTLHLMFGDQGLFIRKDVFDGLGGYADMPIMEDWDFSVRAHRKGQMCVLKERIGTSARRFREGGVLRTLFRMHRTKIGYLRGVPPEQLAKAYKEVR